MSDKEFERLKVDCDTWRRLALGYQREIETLRETLRDKFAGHYKIADAMLAARSSPGTQDKEGTP
jgi:hypothetical protein